MVKIQVYNTNDMNITDMWLETETERCRGSPKSTSAKCELDRMRGFGGYAGRLTEILCFMVG